MLLLGTAGLVFWLCNVAYADTVSPREISSFIALVVLLAVGLLFATKQHFTLTEHYHALAKAKAKDVDEKDAGFTDDDRYGWALRGLGFSLFYVGILVISAFAGLMTAGQFKAMFLAGNDESVALILISTAVAVFGTLMFVYKRIREKHDAAEPFSMHRFWSGLSFRCGQAVLYTVAITLIIFSGYSGNAGKVLNLAWLPVVALFIGMYVTCAEGLFFSIGHRLRAMIAAAVGVDEKVPTDLKKYQCELDPEIDGETQEEIHKALLATKNIVLARVQAANAYIVTTADGPGSEWIKAQFFIFDVSATITKA